MTKNSNPTSKTTKLSDAQIKMLTNMSYGKYRVEADEIAITKRAAKLVEMGLAQCTFLRYGVVLYTLTLDGQETLNTLNGTVPQIESTPAIIEPAETVEPAAPVIAETPAPKMGDTVSAVTPRGKPVTGKVVAKGCKVVSGFNYVHVLAGDETHEIAADSITPIAPRMDEDTYPVLLSKDELYQAMKAAEIVSNQYAMMDTFDLPADHPTCKRKVAAHVAFLRAQAAYAGVSNEGIIAYLYGTQKALKSSVEAVSSPSQSIQVQVSTVTPTAPQIAVSAELKPSGDDDFIPPSTSTYVHPMRLIQPGSVAYNLPDEATVKAKRQQQYEEAKARVERINGAYQSPVRKEMHMHDSGYFNQFFKDAK